MAERQIHQREVSLSRRLTDFFGLRRNVAALLAAMVIIGSGEELWMRFVPKYLDVLGAAALAIGCYDALKTLLGAVYAYPGGILADRWGHRQALVFFTALSIAGYLIVLAVPHWAAVLGASFLFLAWTSFSLPATFSLVGRNLTPEKYGMGIAVQAIVKRIPILVAPVLGGILMDHFGFVRGMRVALLISAVLGFFAILIQRRISEQTNRKASSESSERSHDRAQSPGDTKEPPFRLGFALAKFRPELRHLLLSDILVRFCERIPYTWVVIYVIAQPGMGAREFGYLTGVEVATAMFCFIPVAYVSDRYGRESFVVLTFVFFTLFPFFLLQATTVPWLVAAFVIRGLKEFGEPARKALIIQFSSGASQGQLVGAYYLARDLVVAPGALLGAWLWKAGARMNFLGAFFFGLAGTLYYVFVLLRHRRR